VGRWRWPSPTQSALAPAHLSERCDERRAMVSRGSRGWSPGGTGAAPATRFASTRAGPVQPSRRRCPRPCSPALRLRPPVLSMVGEHFGDGADAAHPEVGAAGSSIVPSGHGSLLSLDDMRPNRKCRRPVGRRLEPNQVIRRRLERTPANHRPSPPWSVMLRLLALPALRGLRVRFRVPYSWTLHRLESLARPPDTEAVDSPGSELGSVAPP